MNSTALSHVFDWFSEILYWGLWKPIKHKDMPVIKVWCLPIQGEEKLNKLHKTIVNAVVNVNELKLKDENDMTILFPSDLMKYGLGSVIVIEISGIFQKKERTQKVLQRLSVAVGKSVKNLYPNAKVECSTQTLNPKDGFWESESEPRNNDFSPRLSDIFGGRLLNSLIKAGIETEKQLLTTSAIDILKLPSLGTYSFLTLKKWIDEKGHILKDMERISKLLKEGYTILYIKSKLI